MSAVRRIYLGNLPYRASEDDILKFLQLSHHEATIELITDRDDPSRRLGFGFATVPAERVDDVLSMDGEQLSGRRIKVALAKPSYQKPSKWEKVPSSRGSGAATVMYSKPKRGIPQDVLDKLQALRLRLEAKKQSPPNDDAVPAARSPSPFLLVDVGANLTNFRFKGHLEEVVERSMAAGVHKVMITGTSVEDSQMALLLAQSLPGVLYCTCGLHPHHAKNWTPACAELLESLLASPEVVAVGETGLDFYRMFSTKEHQLEAFSAQVEIACKFGKPLFLHERDAHTDLVQVLQRFKDKLPPVLIHCFTGSKTEAERYVELGFYIGLTGFICKPDRGSSVRSLLKEGSIPLDRLVVETDAPFMLPPLPSKGYSGMDPHSRNNEPCTLPLVVKTVSELCGVSVQEVAERTTANAVTLFGL